MENDKVKLLLEDMTFNSDYEIFEEGKESNELKEVAKKRGIKIPSKDLAFFKCKYAFVDKKNLNGCTLPKDEVKKALGTLNGKPIDKDHLRRNTIGVWLDAELEGETINAYGSIWKSNFQEEYEEIKERMKEDSMAISFEAWGDRDFHSAKDYKLSNIEFAGGALLFDTKPAFPGAEVLEFSTKKSQVLEFAKIIVEESRIDVTENYIRIRQIEPKEFEEDSFRTITISKSKAIKAIIGKLKGESSTTVQSYLFDKDKWNKEDAQSWVLKHKGEEAREEAEEIMEEAKLDFNYDGNNIARVVYNYDCPTCKAKGWQDVQMIDFENSKIKHKCIGCGEITETDMTPTSVIKKQGKKPKPVLAKEEKIEVKNNKEGGNKKVDELLKKYNKASAEELIKFIDEAISSLDAKSKELAALTKQMEESKLKIENSAIELEKVKVEAKAIKDQLDAKLASEKAAFVKSRRDELGEEFAKDLSDEDISNDLRFENAKLKKELAKVKKETANITDGKTPEGLNAGSKIEAKVEESFKKQNTIRETAFGK